MKNVLIATRKKDKFKIVKKLLSTNTLKNVNFVSLNDIDEDLVDKQESGDVIKRSKDKAMNAYNCLKKGKYDIIIGIDDGIKLKNKVIENVKEYIKPIINDEYLLQDEIVYIVRAYTFVYKNGSFKSILTEIPFKYSKSDEKIEIKENSYPLSFVLKPLDFSKTVSELTDDESNTYYFKYSKKSFNEIEGLLNDK